MASSTSLGPRTRLTAARLDPIDVALLGTLPLSLVPGVRLVTVWPALWFVPGWFVARYVLRATGFLRYALALALSVATTTALCLPATTIASRPSAIGIVGSIFAAAFACRYARPTWIALPSVPAPPRPFFVLLGLFVLLRVACAVRAVEPDLSTPDGAYFVGMVRGLATSFPPSCFESASARLLQPWGYWFLYAATQLLSGWSVAQTLGIASALLALTFAGTLYLLAYALTGDRVAGALTLPLVLGGGGARWIVASIGARELVVDQGGWGGAQSSAENVWDGFYDLPPLLLVTLVLALATLALRDRSAPLGALAFIVATLLPFHHPTYFLVLALSVGAALLFEVGRRSVSWVALGAVLLAPVPFYLLYVRLYAPGIPALAPFFTDMITPSYWLGRSYDRFVGVLGWGGLWLLPAVVGAARAPLHARSFVVALLAVSLALAVFTDNAAHNGHWPLDPLAIALVVLTASTCAWAIRERRQFGVGLAAALLLLGVIAGHWERRLPEHLAELLHPAPRTTEAQRELAAWLRTNTPEDARIVAPANDQPAIEAIEGLGERRLFYGFDFHLALTTPPGTLDALRAENAEMLRDPASSHLARGRIDYVVVPRGEEGSGNGAWAAAGLSVFGNDRFVVYRVAAWSSAGTP